MALIDKRTIVLLCHNGQVNQILLVLEERRSIRHVRIQERVQRSLNLLVHQFASLLQQRLLMLKQVLLLNIHVAQVAEAVGVLEHLAASHGFVDGHSQKLELLHGVLFEIVKHFDLVVDHRPQFASELLRLVVVVVALKVKYIFLQLELRIFTLFHLRVIDSLVLILVTFIVATCRLVVVLPWT